MRALTIACAVLIAAGCADSARRPYLGKWNGSFVVEKSGTDVGKQLARNNLTGYLQLYATNDKFALHLVGEQEALDATGVWSARGDRLELSATVVQIYDAGGEMKRDATKKFIPADDLRNAYRQTQVLRLSSDQLKLVGLQTNIGPVIGHLEFKKVTNTYTY